MGPLETTSNRPISENMPASEKKRGGAIGQLVTAYLQNNDFYATAFFPTLARQESAAFHRELDKKLWSGCRYLVVKMFRDSGKTSRLRLFLSKRIAYGYSRTILYVSKSQAMAIRSLEWLKKEVETNKTWTDFYGLSIGGKWTNEEIEIRHAVTNTTIRIIAVGITGQVRGTNVDNYRPDLIICDDVDDESTVTTPEQIFKTREVFFGGLANSLAPRSENPHALMVLAQTPLSSNDLVQACCEDPQWQQMEISCFDYNEGGDLISSWPARYPLEELLASKEAYRARGMLSSWLREKEVTVINKEDAPFNKDTLVQHDNYEGIAFEKLVIAIDPASSDSVKADFQAVSVLGLKNKQPYLIAYTETKGEDVESSADAIFASVLLCRKFFGLNPTVVVEGVAYQRVLAKYLVSQQKERGVYFVVKMVQDKRKKEDRIIQSLTPVSNAGAFHVLKTHTKFMMDFEAYPSIKHDDLLDSVSIGVDELVGLGMDQLFSVSKERPTVANYQLAAPPSRRRIIPQRIIKSGR